MSIGGRRCGTYGTSNAILPLLCTAGCQGDAARVETPAETGIPVLYIGSKSGLFAYLVVSLQLLVPSTGESLASEATHIAVENFISPLVQCDECGVVPEPRSCEVALEDPRPAEQPKKGVPFISWPYKSGCVKLTSFPVGRHEARTHPQTTERTMLRVRALAVTYAREVSRSSCAARGGGARAATACHASRVFSDSSRVLAPPQPPPSTAVCEHDDHTHSERAVGAGGAMNCSQQQDGEVEGVGDALQRQSLVVSYILGAVILFCVWLPQQQQQE